MVERFFRDLAQKRLRRGVFHDAEELIMAIFEYINKFATLPFIPLYGVFVLLLSTMRRFDSSMTAADSRLFYQCREPCCKRYRRRNNHDSSKL